MKFKIYFFLLLSCAWLFSQSPQHADEIRINNDLKLLHLTDSIYVHISWFNSKDFGRFSSNGMLIIKKGQALMIDTPMNIEMTEQLYNFVRDSMHVVITKFIAGHYHEDCIGGLEFLQSKGVASIANFMTIEKCKELNLPLPEKS